jgi:uncharacterized protein YndB with AHSA1/START domain
MPYGQLIEHDHRYTLYFERKLRFTPSVVFDALVDPNIFAQWYPFATGVMDVKVGGHIKFDDGEGAKYHGMITKLDAPREFEFIEDATDVIHIRLEATETGTGTLLKFSHTFDSPDWIVPTATGWHNCLNVFRDIMNGYEANWPMPDELTALAHVYEERFASNYTKQAGRTTA